MLTVVGLGAMVSSCALPPVGATKTSSTTEPSAADYPAGIRTGVVRMSKDGSGAAPARATPPERREVTTVVFADTAGYPLSFSPTGADCTGACLKVWQPALAGPRSQPVGDWTLVNHGSGKLQWALRGKPLYVRVGDDVIDKPAEFPDYDPTDPWFTIGIPLQSSASDGMQLALVEPQSWINMPFSMSVAEYRIAPGQVLVGGVTGNNPAGSPLYVFSGTAEQEKTLPAGSSRSMPRASICRLVTSRSVNGPIAPGVGVQRRCPVCWQLRYQYGLSQWQGCGSGNRAGHAGELLRTPQVIIKKDSLAIGRIVHGKQPARLSITVIA